MSILINLLQTLRMLLYLLIERTSYMKQVHVIFIPQNETFKLYLM